MSLKRELYAVPTSPSFTKAVEIAGVLLLHFTHEKYRSGNLYLLSSGSSFPCLIFPRLNSLRRESGFCVVAGRLP